MNFKKGDAILKSKNKCMEDLDKNNTIPQKTISRLKSEEIEEDLMKEEICQNLERSDKS